MKNRLLMVIVASGFSSLLFAQDKSPPNRFGSEIMAFEEADKKSPPPEHAILFVGASGIKL